MTCGTVTPYAWAMATMAGSSRIAVLPCLSGPHACRAARLLAPLLALMTSSAKAPGRKAQVVASWVCR